MQSLVGQRNDVITLWPDAGDVLRLFRRRPSPPRSLCRPHVTATPVLLSVRRPRSPDPTVASSVDPARRARPCSRSTTHQYQEVLCHRRL